MSTWRSLVQRCDRAGRAIPAGASDELAVEFDTFVHGFDRCIRTLPARDAGELGARVKAAVMPLMRRAHNGWRWHEKPRGYAGDYLSIARIYDDEPSGEDPVGALIDRCFLRLPAALAVQNRRELLASEIRSTVQRGRGHAARVTTLAAGPARELFEVYAHLDEPRALISTLVDFDPEALAHCAARVTPEMPVELVQANLIHVALGRRTLELAPQDLVYSIGLIDYFNDALVVKLLDWIYTTLRPGGRVIVGNFHPRNPTRAVMDHVLDWTLVHRDEADMHALFRASAFASPCTRIVYERQGINLFAECTKT